MLKIKVTARCSASIEKTFIGLTDFKTMKAANPELEKITHTHGELGVYSSGVRFRKSIISGGRIYDEDVEVIDCSAPDSFTERAFSMGVEYKTRARLLSIGHQTEVKAEYDFNYFELKTKLNLPLQATAIKQKMHAQWLQLMRAIDPSVGPKSITVELKIFGQSPVTYWAAAATSVCTAVIMAVGILAKDHNLDPNHMPNHIATHTPAVAAAPKPGLAETAPSVKAAAQVSAQQKNDRAPASRQDQAASATAEKKQPMPKRELGNQLAAAHSQDGESGLPETVVDLDEVKPIRKASKRAERGPASEPGSGSGSGAIEDIINDTLSSEVQAEALSEE